MSHDRSRLAQLKLVILLNWGLDSELTERAALTFHVSNCSAMFQWQVISCTNCNNGTYFCFLRCKFALTCHRKYTHMENLERMIRNCIIVSDSI